MQTCGFLDISAGNLVDAGYDFAKVWDQSAFLTEIRDLPSYKGKCGGCAYVRVCGGCRARAWAMSGDYLAEDPICWYVGATHASSVLTDFQKRLCNRLQEGLPLSAQPFAEIAKALDSTESEVLQQTRELKDCGIIRRLSAFLNHRALGMASTLVTAHVPPDRIDRAAAAVNALAGVSHNYLREHHYNLWFTLQGESPERIEAMLAELRRQLDIEFHSLPVTQVFKLDVRFDLESDDDALLHDDYEIPGTEPVPLRPEHKQVLSGLQQGIDVVSRPFDGLGDAGAAHASPVSLLVELNALGVLRRIAAVVNHHKLGYTTNVLFAVEAPPASVVEAGRSLARFRAVSHCYERKTFEGWPYNLFAMLHARSPAQIERTVREFAAAADVRSYCLLPTVAELKKQPVRHKFL